MSHWLPRTARALFVPALLVAVGASAHAAGGLGFLQIVRDGAGVDGLQGARGIAVSSDGTSVYAVGDQDDAVAIFRRDPVSGRVGFVGREKNDADGVSGLDRVRGVAISPDGSHVYATGSRDDAVVVFRRNPATGGLAFVERERDGLGDVTGLDGPEGIAVSPDGLHLYVAAVEGSAVVVFTRDPTTGGLRFVEAQQDNVGAVHGLAGAQAVAVSPDGRSVYVAAPDDKSVVVFGRAPATGMLTFVERQHDGTDGVDGLDGARGVAVSADGLNVYVAGKLDKALAVFARDPTTGRLTYLERQQDGVDGVDGLDGVEAVALSPDGSLVYTVASDDNAVAVFGRDPNDGTLVFFGLQRDGVGTIDGLQGPHALAISPDGGQVYATAQDTAALLAFGAACGNGQREGDEQCDDGNGLGGDGCSAGCRVECAEVGDCEDEDSCTESRCRGGECVRPRCGFTGGLCELADGAPGLQALPACTAARKLGPTMRRRLKQARHTLRMAQRRPAASGRDVATRLRELLTALTTKAGKLEQRQAISAECFGSLTDAVDALARSLVQIVQRRGLCPV